MYQSDLTDSQWQVIEVLPADQGYRGEIEESIKKYNLKLKIAKARGRNKGFRVEAKRWIVERTFSWLNWMRRLSKDYECNTESAAAFLYFANIAFALRKF